MLIYEVAAPITPAAASHGPDAREFAKNKAYPIEVVCYHCGTVLTR